jgi:hypothetical protein
MGGGDDDKEGEREVEREWFAGESGKCEENEEGEGDG